MERWIDGAVVVRVSHAVATGRVSCSLGIDSSEKKRARWRTGLEISFLVLRRGRIFPKKFPEKRGLPAKDVEKARNVIRWNYRET